MLRITQQTSADSVGRYFSAADYYAEGRETVGRWGGEAARRLGLSGRVEKEAFGRLCENRHPGGGGPLTARSKGDRTVGYDFTWSVPKSVSLLYALGGDEQLLEAFRASVEETMRDVEREMKARVRKEGTNAERATGNMAWAEFVHFTSRPVGGVPDPQLHAHCFVFNATWDESERQWKAGQFRDLKRDAPYWQAAFRSRLADRIRGLGYAVEKGEGDFEIAGIPPEVLRRFSRRTEKIEELAKELGIDDPDRKALLGATSRELKNRDLTWEQLRRTWRERLSTDERGGLERTLRARRPSGLGPTGREKDAVDFAIAHRFERESAVDEKRLLADALGHGLGEVTVEGVRRELARRPLIVRDYHQRRMVTTPEVLAEEDGLVAFAREGRGTLEPLGAGDRPLKRDWLNAGQRRAVEHVLSSRDRVVLIRGAAGTGKTSLMQEAVEAIREGGHEVVVLAPSASASRGVLRKEGFAGADTVARFLCDEEMQRKASKQVIWVDEAGLLGARDLSALFAIAERRDARVVLSGDRFQHGSVGRGAVLRLLEEAAGVPSCSVTEIVRQKGAYERAVRLLSEGKALRGFDALDRLGWIHEVPSEERYLRLAQAYIRSTNEKKPGGRAKTALVISPTHAEAERIHAAIRKELTERGALTGERELAVWRPAHLTEAERGEASRYAPGDMLQFHQNAKGHRSGERLVNEGRPLPLDQAARFQVYRPGVLRVAVGDRVRITANGKTRDGGHRLDNGSLFTVKGFDKRGDIVLDNGWVVDRGFGHLAHGYVVTSHASQGRTVDEVFIGQSSQSFPASGREQFYVSASRGRGRAEIFTDDRRSLREAVARAEERPTATELAGGDRPRLAPLREHLRFQRRLAADRPPELGGAERGREERRREVARER